MSKMFRFTVCFLFVFIFFDDANANKEQGMNYSSINENVKYTIQSKQPYITPALLDSRLKMKYVQSKLMGSVVDKASIAYESKKGKTHWVFSDSGVLTKIVFIFELSEKVSEAESKLLQSLKAELTEERLVAVSSSTRILEVKNWQQHYDLELYFPVKVSSSPRVKSITINFDGGEK